MLSAKRLVLQGINYALFMGLVWYFSFSPPYVRLAADEAMISLALSHAGKPVQECRRKSQEELNKLPPNMRVLEECPRERSPVRIEVLVDDQAVIDERINPPGLYRDQGVDVYHSVKVPVGDHRLEVRMNDNVRVAGPTHHYHQSISLSAADLLVIQFNHAHNQFLVK
ncbi:MAG: hypothetical protein KDI83_11485 [Gammaproteobacteria bacterium]|nr:hypothetical protein [Gammaproteobacteria bacterium]